MSAGSGIKATKEAIELSNEVKKNSSKTLFALFKVDSSIPAIVPDVSVPDSEGLKANDAKYAEAFKTRVWPQFVKALENADGPRFSVIDFAYPGAENRTIRTVLLLSWCSDKVTARVKMAFASSKTDLENTLNIGKKYAASDFGDLEYDSVLESLQKV